jgi:hypothetical protein
MNTTIRSGVFMAVVATAIAGCTGRFETALEKLSDARSLSADLLVQFTKSADAGNRAVIAVTDEASSTYARESESAMQAVQKDVDTLGPILSELGYSAERTLLEEFGKPLAEYRALNQNILGLAVENTNLKAQRLSFGSGEQAADAFRDALEPVRQSATESNRWQVEALIARAIGAVREIQVVQAPHIDEADDAAMTRMEKRMATAEGTARRALDALVTAVTPGSRPRLGAAVAALDRFVAVSAEIVALSRRNSNVRSLALSLGEKRELTAQCEDALRALQQALAKRNFGPTR